MTKILAKLTLMVAALLSTAQAADNLGDLFNRAQTTLTIYQNTYSTAYGMSLTKKTQTELERDFAPWKLQDDATYGKSFQKISKAVSFAGKATPEHICHVLAITPADFTNAIHLIESRMPELTQQKEIIKFAFETQLSKDAEDKAQAYASSLERVNSGVDHWRSSK